MPETYVKLPYNKDALAYAKLVELLNANTQLREQVAALETALSERARDNDRLAAYVGAYQRVIHTLYIRHPELRQEIGGLANRVPEELPA